ncbi:MAG TPA: cytochrome P450 [Acidimicrobiales bacterium]|nr:cytochrome P450 [Acidimicrobiales bacterium]
MTAPSIDPTDPAFFVRTDLHQVLARLRAEAPVLEFAPGLWSLTRYHDIRFVSSHPEAFCSGHGSLVNDPMRAAAHGSGGSSLIHLDPPEHRTHRRLVSSRFTPRSTGGWEERIRAYAGRVIAAAPASETIDAVEHLTAPFPLLVIAELLGIAEGDRADFRRWSDATIESTDAAPGQSAATIGEFLGFMNQHLDAKRAAPGDDIVSMLVNAELDGRPLTRGELIAFLMTLLVAGNETTRTLLSGSLVALDEHPDQRRVLVPGGVDDAVIEECLRWVTPVNAFCRTAAAPVEVGGQTVPEGDYLVMLYAAANRDEEVFGPDADRFDVARPVQPQHLAFGFGEHLCLGASLARLEARVFLEELLAAYPSFAVVGDTRRTPSTIVASIAELPVVLAP